MGRSELIQDGHPDLLEENAQTLQYHAMEDLDRGLGLDMTARA
jgi:hypothetical protein